MPESGAGGYEFYRIFFWIFTFYFLFLVFYYFCLGVVGFYEARKRQKQHEREAYVEMSVSDFTIPVSVIIPAHNEELWIADSVQSILNLEYPQFELIVVDDGSKDRTMEILKNHLDLEIIRNPYRDHFDSGKIRGIFKSRKYPHVTVLSKEGGQKKAGALNAAMNLAKYKYICSMDGDTILEKDALMKVMAHIQRAPENVVGAGSCFGLSNGFSVSQGKVIKRSFFQRPLVAYQNLEYIRSFIGNRISWSSWNAMPIVAGGFQIWRRDVVESSGGFDPAYSSEDLEFTFRVHDTMVRGKKAGYKILMLPYLVGWTEGPGTIFNLLKQRNRWQRVILEAIWKYKHMLFNWKYKGLGVLTMPYFILYEALGPFFEIASILITLNGYFSGVLSLRFFFAMFSLMLLCNCVATLVPLAAYNRHQRFFKTGEAAYFIVLSFLEFLWYRWIQTIAKLWGTFDFLRGERKMDKVERHRT